MYASYPSQQRRSFWATLGYFLGAVVFVFLVGGLVVFAYFAKDLPNPEAVGERLVPESTKIFDQSGEVSLFNIHGDIKRTVISFDEIPNTVKHATVAIEDDDFYNHIGIDVRSVGRALLINLRRGNPLEGQGASTITQQFIKNSLLTPEQTLSRKIREWILAVELERRYAKNEILGFYLNQIPYGSNAYGIEAAAQTYFDKHARDLTLAEAALLASLPRAPSYYSPYGVHKNELLVRKDRALSRMAQLGLITPEEAREAQQQPLAFAEPRVSITAPHFVMFVREYLERRYGRDVVEQGGLRVTTTLDMDVQEATQTAITEGALRNEQRFGGENAAAVVVEPATGKLRAMAGSRDFFDETIDGNVNVATRPQQPGSAFKPFAYARAFEKGYTPNTVLFDVPTNFHLSPDPPYTPKNYSETFRGPLSMRESLAQSINVTSVKTLYLAGVNSTIDLAERLGITTLTDRDRYGLALVLGGGDVLLTEMTNAYATFANDGITTPLSFIERVEDRNGNILESFSLRPTRAIDTTVARSITSILSDTTARSPVFGASSPLSLSSRPVAAKTGTTQEFRDAWTVGYTPQYAVGVWAGNNDNTPMHNAPGASAAAPIWNTIMTRIHADLPVIPFPPTPPISQTTTPMLNGSPVWERTVVIDSTTGVPATNETPSVQREQRTIREAHTILFYINKDRPSDGTITRPNDPLFLSWEQPVLAWAQRELSRQRYDLSYLSEQKPSADATVLSIISPVEGARIQKSTVDVVVSLNTSSTIRVVEFLWDGVVLTTDSTAPYNAVLHIPPDSSGGDHTITVRAVDEKQHQTFLHRAVFLERESSSVIQTSLTQERHTPTPRFRITTTDDGDAVALKPSSVSMTIVDLQTDAVVYSRTIHPSSVSESWIMEWEQPQSGSFRVLGSLTTFSQQRYESNALFVTIE